MIASEDKVLRYIRILKEIIEENFSNPNTTNLSVTEFLPANFDFDGSNFKVGGINVTVTMA